MKAYRALAFKELTAQKVTSLLILAAILLSTRMTAAVGQSAGVLSAMRQQQAIALGGHRYATFVQLTQAQTELLQREPRLSYVGLSIDLGSRELNQSLTLGLTEYIGDAAAVYPALSQLEAGRLPTHALEIALPADALGLLGFTGQVGDPISLSLAKALRHGVAVEEYPYTATFTLTGILQSNYLGYTGGIVRGVVGPGTGVALLPTDYLYYTADIRTAEKRTFQATVDDLAAQLALHPLDTMYNEVYLKALGIPYDAQAADSAYSDEGFSFLLLAGILVGGLILLAAGLVIYNVLKISVTRRIRQYGTLRAMGCSRGQLYSLVITEVLLLSAAGIPLGLLLGTGAAKGILNVATGLLSPSLFLVQDSTQLQQLIAQNSAGKGLFLLLSAGVTLVFALMAALPAARLAARVSPITALAGPRVTVRRRHCGARRIRRFAAYYARLNLKRSRGRTAITILSLVMSITVFITLQGFVSLLNAAGPMEGHLGDYSLVNETAGFTPGDLAALQDDTGVQAVAAMQFSLYLQDDRAKLDGISIDFPLQPGETFQVVGLNDPYWDDLMEAQLPPQQLAALKAGEGCVVRNPIPLSFQGKAVPRTTIQAGSTITVAGHALPVLDTLDDYDAYLSVGNNGFTNGVQVIVADSLYPQLTGTDAYAELLPILAAGADRTVFDDVLRALCDRIPGTSYLSYEESDRQLAESFAQTRLLAWGLILLIGLIGLLNIVNAVYTNLHTRRAEIGMQRAIGMSVRSLYQTFLWEGAYYGLIAAIIGCAAGYLGTVLAEAAATDALQLVAVPIIPMAEAAVLSVGACLAATILPLRKIAQTSIVDSIKTGE